MSKRPLQPIVRDERGIIRFEANKIVCFLLDAGPFDMNQLACMEFSPEDRAQFAQLIGYSVSGYGDLSYAKRVKRADRIAAKLALQKAEEP